MTILRNPETEKEVTAKTTSKTKLSFSLDAKKFQVILGSLWILDAFLQMQPKMFGTTFISMVISPNADGQSSLIHHVISSMSSFLSSNVALWNTLFVLIQFSIGLGILFNKTFRASVIASIFWAGGVWCFGERFGGIFKGLSTVDQVSNYTYF
jgi:hypothetical protein